MNQVLYFLSVLIQNVIFNGIKIDLKIKKLNKISFIYKISKIKLILMKISFFYILIS